MSHIIQYNTDCQQQQNQKMDRLFRSKTTLQQKSKAPMPTLNPQQTHAPKQQLLLPNSIGCRIIQLEMQIDDGNLNKQLIIQLLQQYTKAVQFYQEKGDQRHKMYQKKIQNFLQRSAVDTILKGKNSQNNVNIMKREKAQEQIRKATHVNTNIVKKIMENSDQGLQKQKLKIQKQLNFQLQNLQERIKRKRINSQKGSKVTSASFSASSTSKDQQPFLMSFQQVKNPKNKVYL